MKKTPLTINRGKPPSVRSPLYLSSKNRGYLNERTGFHLPSLQLGPERLISMSENAEVHDETHPQQFTSKEIADCMANWLTFLKVLQSLCTSGSELVNSLSSLGCGSPACKSRADHCKAMWEQLSHSTATAASIIRNQTVASLQEAHLAPDIDSDQAEANQAVVCSGLLRLLNLQYQFSVMSCDWCCSGPQQCPCVLQATGEREAVARCFSAGKPPLTAGTTGGGGGAGKCPHPGGQVPQRRWSEVTSSQSAPGERAELRRWSIPWKLALPTAEQARSRSTTPDAVWHTALASQDDLQDVISLLSGQPAIPHTPGVVLTRADGHHLDNSAKGGIHQHRGSWWTDSDETPEGGQTRKSSTSTDSSSCYSNICHSSSDDSHLSRSGGGGGGGAQVYSMWSGSELPFIKLPESSSDA